MCIKIDGCLWVRGSWWQQNSSVVSVSSSVGSCLVCKTFDVGWWGGTTRPDPTEEPWEKGCGTFCKRLVVVALVAEAIYSSPVGVSLSPGGICDVEPRARSWRPQTRRIRTLTSPVCLYCWQPEKKTTKNLKISLLFSLNKSFSIKFIMITRA